MAENAPAGDGERVALHAEDAEQRRRRLRLGITVAVVLAAALGGLVALFSPIAGLITAVVVAAPLLYLVGLAARRRMWLDGSNLLLRTWGTRTIDLTTVMHIDLMVTDLRGVQTVSLLIRESENAGGVKIDLASYSPGGGREIGVLALRKLANAVMDNIDANGMVFAELLVAQLRAEAKEVPSEARPLHRLASAAPRGKLMQRYSMELVSKFVAGLD